MAEKKKERFQPNTYDNRSVQFTKPTSNTLEGQIREELTEQANAWLNVALEQLPTPKLKELVRSASARKAQPEYNVNDRKQVVSLFNETFELIGGVARFAVWANDNPTQFYTLYSKLIPVQVEGTGEQGEIVIKHALAKRALDDDEMDHQGRIIDVTPETHRLPDKS